MAFGISEQEVMAAPTTAIERRYALRVVKQRLHQASFREAVIAAYNGRCAVTGLFEPLLLDAASPQSPRKESLIVGNGPRDW